MEIKVDISERQVLDNMTFKDILEKAELPIGAIVQFYGNEHLLSEIGRDKAIRYWDL